MNAAVLVGLAFAAGLLLVASGLLPARPPLTVVLGRLHQTRQAQNAPASSRLTRLVGVPLARGAVGTSLRRRFAVDLRITGQRLDDLIARVVLCGLVGLLWAPATATLTRLGGVSSSPLLIAWVSSALGFVGAGVPLLSLKSAVSARRRAFRHALSCFLDLVAVRLAGGAGVDGALSGAASSGDGWAFAELRQALAEARLMGRAPWVALDRLGADLSIPELSELAASVTLAGDEGAKVRTSIAAKARAIRVRSLADAEANAQAASERMSLPIVLLMVGFVVFLGYPAVNNVITGL